MRSTWRAAPGALRVACCVWRAAHGTLRAALFALRSSHCALRTALFALHSLRGALRTALFALRSSPLFPYLNYANLMNQRYSIRRHLNAVYQTQQIKKLNRKHLKSSKYWTKKSIFEQIRYFSQKNLKNFNLTRNPKEPPKISIIENLKLRHPREMRVTIGKYRFFAIDWPIYGGSSSSKNYQAGSDI